MGAFILIEDDGHGLTPRSGGFVTVEGDLFNDEVKARLAQDDASRDAERHGIPVVFRLFELTEVQS